MRIRVGELASGRAGDKGDVLDLTLVARDEGAYALLANALDADTVRRELNRVVPGPVRRYEIPGLRALKFVAPEALPGGVYASLRPGLHWQKAAIWLLLDMEIDDRRSISPHGAQHIDCALDSDGILTITLMRPERLNAFTVQMADELVEAFRRASADDAVRAVVVTGAGRVFCAGMDLVESQGGNVFGLDESLTPTLRDLKERPDDPDFVHGLRDSGGRVALAMFDCLKPIVAAINGAAVGVGVTMTLPMDMRIAARRSRFCFAFVRIGIVPDACSSWFLPRIVGLPLALQWSLGGEFIDAEEALRGRLVDELVADDELLERARQAAIGFTQGRSAVSVALTRQMMWRNSSFDHPLPAHRVESLGIWHASRADGREGARSFLEKRVPEFQSRASCMPEFYPWW